MPATTPNPGPYDLGPFQEITAIQWGAAEECIPCIQLGIAQDNTLEAFWNPTNDRMELLAGTGRWPSQVITDVGFVWPPFAQHELLYIIDNGAGQVIPTWRVVDYGAWVFL